MIKRGVKLKSSVIRISFVEKPIRITTKTEKNSYFFINFFLLITQKMTVMLFYNAPIKPIYGKRNNQAFVICYFSIIFIFWLVFYKAGSVSL